MNKPKTTFKKLKKLILASGIFDKEYYLKNNSDARLASETPIDHFCKVGIFLNKQPSEKFDPNWYIENYPDIKNAGVNPIEHYIAFGEKEKRLTNKKEKDEYAKLKQDSFDINFYKNSYEDLKIQKEGFDFLLHYIRYGKKENRDQIFFTQNHDLDKKEIAVNILNMIDDFSKPNLQHLMKYYEETISSFMHLSTLFSREQLQDLLENYDEEKYLRMNPDIQHAIDEKMFIDGFEHYLKIGMIEVYKGRRQLKLYEDTNDNSLYLNSLEKDNVLPELILNVPTFNEPIVSIVIPAYNQSNYTYSCVKSVIENTDIPYEVIIMDDKSPNEDARNLQNNIANTIFVSNEENLGFLKNCNKGASLAKGKYIFFLNNDTNVQPNWLNSLVSLMESSEDIGMVGSRLVYPDGRQQEAGGIVWNDASGWNFGRLDDPTKPEYNYVKEVDYISGAAIMIKKDLWNEIGGFDERYVPAYYEDTDLAFEVRKHGYKVMYQPRSIVVHFEGISNGTDLGSGIKKYQVVNHKKFFDKWKDILQKEHFKNAENVLYARDRSKDKKHILIIDHYIPHYDKDAGSRTMWQYLLMLQEMGYKITFVGDNFFKHEPYTSILEEAGIEILYGPYYYNNFTSWLENNGHYFDYVYLLRPHISIKYIDNVKKYTSAKIFYNGTDFHFLRMQREYELSKDKNLLASIDAMEKQEISLFEKVDCVLTISDYERAYFEKRFPEWDIKVIPTYVYKESFPLSRNNDFSQRDGILFVGGFTHSPNLEGVKWFLKYIWPSLLLKIPTIKFYIVGSNMPDEILQLEDDNIFPKGFIEDSELNELYNSVKVVVAPLTFGAGVKGKIIESICHGVPVVTTSVGAEGIVDADLILSVEDEDSKFANAVQLMYTKQALWNKTRNLEIKYAENNFGYDYAKKLMKTIFTKDVK